MDFPEDVADSAFPAASKASLAWVQDSLKALLSRRQEVDAAVPEWVLRGPSNAGKSTLLNALIGYERALTDAAPGTTRDAISASLPGLGGRVVLWDTAGHNEGATGVEARGIAMADEVTRRASIVVWLLGPAVGWPPDEMRRANAALWIVGSHADVFDETARQAVEREAQSRGLEFVGWLSALTGEGLAALRDRFRTGLQTDEGEARVALTQRHTQALLEACASLESASRALTRGGADDMALLDVEAALASFEAIFGEGVGPQVFEQIFAQFCIGK